MTIGRRFADLSLRLGPILAACLATAGAVARQTGVPAYRTIWAEDGQVFVGCALTDRSVLGCVLAPYDAWLQIVPRLLAEIAIALPPALLSYALTGLAAAVAATCGYLTARAVQHVTGSSVAGCVAGAGLLLVGPAVREVGGNITNLHWILFAAAVTVIVSTWLDHEFDLADGLLVGLLAWSTPFALLLAALAGFGVLIGHRRLMPIAVLAALAAVVQFGLALTSPRIAVPDLPVGITSPVGWYLDDVVRSGIFAVAGPIPDWLVSAALIVVLVGLTARVAATLQPGARWADIGSPRVRIAVLELLAVVSLVATGAAVFAASTYLNRHVVARYQYVPIALTIVALFVGAGLLARHASVGVRFMPGGLTPGGIALAALAVVVGLGFATSFRAGNRATAGPDVPVEMAAARSGCEPGQNMTIRISPLPTTAIPTVWQVEIPCDRFGP